MRRGFEKTLGTVGGVALALMMASTVVAQESEGRVERDRPMTSSVAGGSGGYLGVRIADVTSETVEDLGLSGEYGVHVTAVVEDGPAEDAGLLEGDVIVAWNGQRVESVAQLQRHTSETPPGRSVELTVVRNGAERRVDVEIGTRGRGFGGANVFTLPRDRVRLSRPDADELRSRVMPRIQGQLGDGNVFSLLSGRPRLGVSLQSMGDQLAAYFGVEGGALVTEVSEDSPAEAAGLRAGDVIVSVDGSDVEGPGDVLEALSDIESGPVEITVIRDGSTRTFTAELEEAENRWERRNGAYFFDREGDGPAVLFRSGEGADFSVAPISVEGFEMAPVHWEGVHLEPMRFDFEWDGEPIEISIPAIDVPGFDLPAIEIPSIEVPGFDLTMPRIEIII